MRIGGIGRNLYWGVMESDGFEGEPQSPVVGRRGNSHRVAEDIINFGVFYMTVSLSWTLEWGGEHLRNASTRLFGWWGNAGPRATKIARINGCS